MKHLPGVHYAEVDNGILASVRMPESEELQQLFACAYEGQSVNFWARRWAWQRPGKANRQSLTHGTI